MFFLFPQTVNPFRLHARRRLSIVRSVVLTYPNWRWLSPLLIQRLPRLLSVHRARRIYRGTWRLPSQSSPRRRRLLVNTFNVRFSKNCPRLIGSNLRWTSTGSNAAESLRHRNYRFWIRHWRIQVKENFVRFSFFIYACIHWFFIVKREYRPDSQAPCCIWTTYYMLQIDSLDFCCAGQVLACWLDDHGFAFIVILMNSKRDLNNNLFL